MAGDVPELLCGNANAAWSLQGASAPGVGHNGGLGLVEEAIGLSGAVLSSGPRAVPAGDHPVVRELPGAGGYRVIYRVHPNTGSSATAGDARVSGPGRDRGTT
jgi:hypothetical protein